MLINTAVFGPLEVDDKSIYELPEGLLGFEDIKRYALIAKQDDDVTLMWFQAVDADMPCFVVFNPLDFIDGYEPEMEKSDIKALNCKTPRELVYLVIAVVPEDVTQTTVNLKSPIVLNQSDNTGRQVILMNKDYPIKYALAQDDGDGQS